MSTTPTPQPHSDIHEEKVSASAPQVPSLNHTVEAEEAPSQQSSAEGHESSALSHSDSTPASTAQSIPFGRIDQSGNVYVTDGAEERFIGGYPDGIPDNPFALYTRRFEDLKATIKLFEDRLPSLSVKDITQTLTTLRESVAAPAAIGDLKALRDRLDLLAKRAEERKEEAKAERKAAREKALADRNSLVEKAESIAGQQPHSTHWKQSGQALRDLLEEWKKLQQRGPRLDKHQEDELWKRFSSARTIFDRHRRQFFAALDQKQTEAKSLKEKLIEEAESLQSSTDWGATSAAYRDLMERWKAVPRASRREDDALWTRFRAAQQVFYDARRAKDQAVDSEQQENLKTKEAILLDAEAILPVTNIDAAKKKLRKIQDRWEKAGRVPSADLSRIEGRMRAVENAVHEAEEREWQRTNPETIARAEGMLGQLHDQISDLERKIANAEAAGNTSKALDLREALTTKKTWLEQIQSSME